MLYRELLMAVYRARGGADTGRSQVADATMSQDRRTRACMRAVAVVALLVLAPAAADWQEGIV